jgi:UDP-N-acetylglucosamine acyltransferase
MIGGNPIGTHGINSEGLKRRNFPPDTILALKRAYKTLYRSKLSLDEARAELQKQAKETPEVRPLVDFIAASTRGILR